MRTAIVNLLLVMSVILLMVFEFRYVESLSLVRPVFELIKENIVVVVGGLVIVLAVMVIYHAPHVRSR